MQAGMAFILENTQDLSSFHRQTSFQQEEENKGGGKDRGEKNCVSGLEKWTHVTLAYDTLAMFLSRLSTKEAAKWSLF